MNTIISTAANSQKAVRKNLFLLGVFILLSANLFYFLSTYNIIHVSGDSMLPTLENNSYVLTRSYYLYESIQAGDIVIADIGDVLIVKRVAAIEGDYILIESNKVYINDELIQTTSRPRNNTQELQLTEDQYILLGDNAEISRDSRNIQDTIANGIFTSEHIIAKVIWY